MTRALLDTSVVIDRDAPEVAAALPDETALSAISLAELSAGAHTSDPMERAIRQSRLQHVESSYDPIPFDRAAARSYGLVVAAVTSSGRSHRRRIADLLIAAVAHANELPLYTRNPDDFDGLEDLVTVVAV